MRVSRLRIRNTKRLRDFELSFRHRGEIRGWTVLIGENGTAKTTILQMIALAAAGSRQINTLAQPIVKYLRDRRGEEPLGAEVEFEFSPRSLLRPDAHAHLPACFEHNAVALRSTMSLGAGGSTSISAEARYFVHGASVGTDDPLDAARDVHSPLWFVAGYGISRGLPDPNSFPPLDLPSIERLQPLFDSEKRLASSSFSNHFLKKDLEEGRKKGTTSRMYSRVLNKAIKLGGPALLPDIAKLELRGFGGARSAADLIESDRFHQKMGSDVHKIAGVALSHGYQSTFAWIADLVGHVLLEAEEELDTTEMEGLVLIDEIDLYLHPVWQASFVGALRRVFPKMQFVATTHSPIVLAGLAAHEVVRLIADAETGDIVRGAWDPETGQLVSTLDADPVQPDPRPMTASEIYRAWFGLERLTPNPLGAELREWRILAEEPEPSGAEMQRRARLRKRLEEGGVVGLDDLISTGADEESG